MEKSPEAFRTISEVAEWLGTPTHVLRFWESRFTQVKPVKRAGGRRYYRPTDMELLGGIKKLLHHDGMTIRGVQKLLREEGARHVAALSPPIDTSAAIEGTVSAVEDVIRKARDQTTPPSGEAVVPEAPIEIDVTPEPLENVVQLGSASDPGGNSGIVEDTDATAEEFEVASTESSNDRPAPPPPAPATFKPAPETSTPDRPAPKTATPDAPGMEQPEQGQEREKEPDPVSETPSPILVDVPPDPADDDKSVPGITGVAASLRGSNPVTAGNKPSPDVFAELYDRLVGLRDRMSNRSGPDSTD